MNPARIAISLDELKALQRRVGVRADGIFGRDTLAAINRALPAARTPEHRKINARARACLHHFEGVRLEAYRCPAGIWTIGWGNTFYPDGRPVRQGDRITRAQAETLFDAVIKKFEVGVEEAAPQATDEQFGAMVSLAYNIGLAAFNQSSVLRHHRAGAHKAAADAFRLWNKGGGKVLPGLVRRREAERALYLNDLATFDRMIGYRP